LKNSNLLTTETVKKPLPYWIIGVFH